jgi:hypothetical protein
MKTVWILFLLIVSIILLVESKPTPAGFPFTCLPKPGKGHRRLAVYRKWRTEDEDEDGKKSVKAKSLIVDDPVT